MQVKTVSIDQIKPYENNPRDNSNAIDAVANSIKEFGWQQPIVVDNVGVIVVGHTRYLAAKKLGLLEVPNDLFTGFDESEIFDDVLNESDASILDDIDEGITYTINFKTQNKVLYQRIKEFINKEQSEDEKAKSSDSGDQRKTTGDEKGASDREI